jgi:hypothetical protein
MKKQLNLNIKSFDISQLVHIFYLRLKYNNNNVIGSIFKNENVGLENNKPIPPTLPYAIFAQ